MTGKRTEYCTSCLRSQIRAKKELRCPTCEYRRPDLLPDNEEVWELWAAVSSQWRTTFGGLVGLDFGAVREIANLLDVDLTRDIFEKLRTLELATLERQGKSRKEGTGNGAKS